MVEKPARRGAPPRVERWRWVAEATALLAEAGVNQVRVQVLAQRLGVTTGGFYGYFRDREALLEEVLETWRRRSTQSISQRVAEADTAKAAFRQLADLTTADNAEIPGGRLEQAIREWAFYAEAPRKVLAEVDAERLRILTDMYVRAGHSEDQAQVLAMLGYAFRIGSNIVTASVRTAAARDTRGRSEEAIIQLSRAMRSGAVRP